MTVTCPSCKRKFHKGKTNEFGRLSKHLWKEHPDYMRKRIRSGQRKKRTKVTKLDKEFMAIDDLLIADLLQRKSTPLERNLTYDPVHEQLGGLLLQAVIPIVTNAIIQGMKKRSAKK